MAGREFQAARDSLVAELSSAKKVAVKVRQKPVPVKRSPNNPVALLLKDNGIKLRNMRRKAL